MESDGQVFERDKYGNSRPVSADVRWPPAQTRQEFFEQVKAGNASPNRQGWRARLANVERMLAVADRWFTAETLTDYRVERGRGCLDDALAEVRAMLDERP